MKHISQVYPKNSSICNCLNIRRASRAVTQFYDDILKPSGLTIAQLGLLRHLDQAEQTTISELARLLRIDRTTLNRNMKPLLEAEMITITPGKDSRTRHVQLTTTGKTAAEHAWSLWHEAQDSLQEYLGADGQEQLTQLLAKLEALAP